MQHIMNTLERGPPTLPARGTSARLPARDSAPPFATRILLIEDDAALTEPLRRVLEEDAVTVRVQSDALRGVEEALGGAYAIVIADAMMPQLSGLELLRRIRARSSVPVLMLTARGDDVERIAGLELGADDYVSKPCTPRELAARVRAILRRTQTEAAPATASVLTCGSLRLWPQARRAEWRETPLHLTSTEFALLEVLLRWAGRPVPKAILSERALGRSLGRFDRNIDVHVCSIRRKLGALADGRPIIQAIYKQGYQLLKE